LHHELETRLQQSHLVFDIEYHTAAGIAKLMPFSELSNISVGLADVVCGPQIHCKKKRRTRTKPNNRKWGIAPKWHYLNLMGKNEDD